MRIVSEKEAVRMLKFASYTVDTEARRISLPKGEDETFVTPRHAEAITCLCNEHNYNHDCK